MKIEELLINLIKYKTVSGVNLDEIDNCISFIKNYFNDTNYLLKEYSFNNDKSIYITNTEEKELDVLFVGHIDVVSANFMQFDPYIKDNKLYGRGSFDMKGHDAVMIELFKNNSFKQKVGLLLTSDEERGGFNGTYKFLNELKYTSKIAIVPDAGNDFQIIDEEKGVLQLKVSYDGKKAHSSQPWNGISAISKMMELYSLFLEKYPLPISKDDYKTSINLARIDGGNLTNEIPSECYGIFDIRHTALDKKEDFINFIKEHDSNVKIEILAKGEPFLTIKSNRLFKQYIKSYERVLSKKVVYSKCESASDGRFFYSKKIPCILMNAIGNNIHSVDEYVEIDSLYKMYDIYYDFLINIK